MVSSISRAVAVKARKGVDQDHIEPAVRLTCRLKHPLEHWPAIVGGRCARLNELLRHHPPASLTVSACQVALRRDRDIAGRLPASAHAQI
jgi:hypothetical protein